MARMNTAHWASGPQESVKRQAWPWTTAATSPTGRRAHRLSCTSARIIRPTAVAPSGHRLGMPRRALGHRASAQMPKIAKSQDRKIATWRR